MKITVDTNVLVRAVVQDDPVQASVAAKVLIDADLIAVATPSLCWPSKVCAHGFCINNPGAILKTWNNRLI